MINRRFVSALALGVALAWTSWAGAQELGIEEGRGLGKPSGPPLEGEALAIATNEVASVLRCPVCQGLSVNDSPSDMAVDMRNKVEELLAQGYDGEQILTYFEGAYGEFVRLSPKPEGFNLVVWILPAIGLLFGAVWVIALQLRRGHGEVENLEGEAGLEAYQEQVRREVSS